jgi:lactoylglutathione lyase
MPTKLIYVIKYVADMGRSVAFYRDTIRLPLKFESPHWTEFATGDTTLALHLANDDHPAGTAQIGLGVADIDIFHADAGSAGVVFTSPPVEQFGSLIAKFEDPDGAECSVSSPAQ